MNLNLQLPLLVCVFYLFTAAIGGISEDRGYPGTTDLIATEYQHTKSVSTPRARVSPTPLPRAWRGLVPLQSTRADVEKVLGKSEKSHYSTYIYNTADNRIDILYSEGTCEPSEVERWN
jgi:hypothetical protein